MMLRKADWFVDSVPKSAALAMVQRHHYARGASNTATFLHGLYRRDTKQLCGVAWWLPPTKGAAMTVHPDWRAVLNLSRLVVLPEVPTNACSFLQAQSIKRIRQDGRWRALVTYADEGEGHTGAIYRAANWTYVGVSSSEERWVDPATGLHVARLATTTRTNAQMEALGYRRTGKTVKHKFVMLLPARAPRLLEQSRQLELA